MAKQQFNLPSTMKRIETEYVAEDGQRIALIAYIQEEKYEKDKAEELIRAANIQLSDGLQWNPSQQRGDKPVLVAVCPACRRPRLFGVTPHGLVSAENAKHCHDCGILCCPKHRRKQDGQWRCERCHRKYRIRSFVQRIFFT